MIAIYVVVALSILATMLLALYRADVGPTWFDRILALNSIGTKTVLLIAVILFVTNRPDFLDLALLYSLMSFIGTVAVLRFSKYGHFAETDTDTDSLTEATS
jgi:multicomponent Na+:H+ antiporter subunit F